MTGLGLGSGSSDSYGIGTQEPLLHSKEIGKEGKQKDTKVIFVEISSFHPKVAQSSTSFQMLSDVKLLELTHALDENRLLFLWWRLWLDLRG